MPSPTFPMSSCLSGVGGRTYRFELDIVANSPRSSHSSASSTLSESSNSTPLFISTKRNRAPRKRPNQCSAEAAALLSSIYPKLFSATNLKRPPFHLQQPPDDPFPVLLPSFPISGDTSTLLLQNLPSSPPSSPIQPIPTKSHNAIIDSPTDFHFQDPGSPDFDAQSILLDEEVEEGIDSIMGNLSMTKDSTANCLNSNSIINPFLASLMGFGRSAAGFGFGFGISSDIRGALRHSNDGEWWRYSPTVAVKDIVPTPLGVVQGKAALMADSKKKKKKKKKTVEKDEGMMEERKVSGSTAVSLPAGDGILKKQLGLKLNYDGVLKDWCGGSPFSGETGSPDSAADVIFDRY